MKGRINVLDDGGVALNASTVNKIIQSGNILAGDFVEYYDVPSWLDLAGGADFKFSIGEYAIATFGGLLAAFRNGRRVATYSDYGCSAINKYNNWIVFYDEGATTVGVLSIENDQFTLIDSIQLTESGDASCIAAGGGKVCITKSNRIVILDIANDGELSNATATSVSITTSYDKFLNYSDGFYYTYTTRRPSGAYTYSSVELYTAEITIDESNNATIGNGIICSGVGIYNNDTSRNGKARQIYQNGRIIGITSTYYQHTTQYSGDEYHGQQGYIYFVNIATGAANKITIADHGEAISCISNGKLLTSKCYKYQYGSSTYQWVFQANGIRLYAFDEETYALTEIAAKTYSENTEMAVLGNRGGCANNFVYIQLRQTGTEHPGGVRIYEVEGNNMGDMTDKNRVIPYMNGDNPIGVAKEGGAAGDTIPVYIPTPSV